MSLALSSSSCVCGGGVVELLGSIGAGMDELGGGDL